MKESQSIRDIILSKKQEGEIVFNTIEGLMTCSFDKFINQPVESLLYDLNRDAATILSFVDKDVKWINDYALSQVVIALKKQLDEANNKIKQLKK